MNDLVLAVILNYNQNDYTLKCLESLLESDYHNLKIMLVDNGSTKSNLEELQRKLPKNSKIIFEIIENNRGYPGGMNFGLKEGLKLDPKYFLIMNNDTVIDSLAITELVKTSLLYKDMARITGKVYHYDDPNRLQDVGHIFRDRKYLKFKALGWDEIDTGSYDRIEERDMIDDVFVLHPAELFKKNGGYSTYFWINAVEKDLSLRAVKSGYKLVYTPFAKLWHKGSISFGGNNMNPKLAYFNIQSSLILRYMYLNKFYFFIYYLKTLKGILGTFIKSKYLKIFKNKDIRNYAKAKIKGLTYFNMWVFKKNDNTGYNPF